ncbi:MAG: hypothetical protein IIX61_05935 [Loktanella sp.]|nr:hypothetical protein [Loktanella sp.]
MTIQREIQLLSEVRDMALLSSASDISQRYGISIDGADAYVKAKIVAIIDTVLDGLNDELAYQQSQQSKKQGQ